MLAREDLPHPTPREDSRTSRRVSKSGSGGVALLGHRIPPESESPDPGAAPRPGSVDSPLMHIEFLLNWAHRPRTKRGGGAARSSY